MPDSPLTVRDVFELPQPNTPEEESPRWQSLRDWMSKEVSSLKRASVPDLTSKVAELLDVPIPDILLTSWKKTNVLRDLLEESRKSPETAVYLELGEHTINSQHRPHIEVKVQNVPVKKLEFNLRLNFKLKGFVLKVQNGAVTELQTGSCEMKGSLEFQGLAVAEKKLAPIKLPGRIPLEAMRGFWETEQRQPAVASAREAATATATTTTATRVVADSPTNGQAKQAAEATPISKPPTTSVARAQEPKAVTTAPPRPPIPAETKTAPALETKTAPATESKPAPLSTVESKAASSPPIAESAPPPAPSESKSASAAAVKTPTSTPSKASEEREEFVL